MNKNINNSYINNTDKELLKFIETKSYKSLRSQDGNNTEINFKAIEHNPINTTKTLDNINIDTLKDPSLNNADEISNYITKEKGEKYSQQASLTYANDEEHIYKILVFLLNLCKTLELKKEDISIILNNTRIFLIQSFQQTAEEKQESIKLIYFNLKRLLGDDFKTKVLLIKRAYTWLGLDKLSNSEEYLSFLTRMSELGNMISEDQGITNEQHSFILTKEEAKKQRNALFSNENFRVALTDKMHPAHKDSLNKLRGLNKIIIS